MNPAGQFPAKYALGAQTAAHTNPAPRHSINSTGETAFRNSVFQRPVFHNIQPSPSTHDRLNGMLIRQCNHYSTTNLDTSKWQRYTKTNRQALSQWLSSLLSFLHQNPTLLFPTMHTLDRFLSATPPEELGYLAEDKSLRLSALIALNLALKINSQQGIHFNTLATLATHRASPHQNRNPSLFELRLTRVDLRTIEKKMLNSLNWKIHPPTTDEFIHGFTDYVVTYPAIKTAIYHYACQLAKPTAESLDIISKTNSSNKLEVMYEQSDIALAASFIATQQLINPATADLFLQNIVGTYCIQSPENIIALGNTLCESFQQLP